MQSITTATSRFWLLFFAACLGLFWVFKPVVGPFLAGLAIAYFLEPVVTKLEKRHVPRTVGTLMVLSGFIFVVAMIVILLWPLLNSEIGALMNSLPDYIARIREHYIPWAQDWLTRFSPEDVEKIRGAATQGAGEAAGWVSHTVQHIVSGSFAVVDAVALSVLTPVTAFHALRDWGKLFKAIDVLIPRHHYMMIREVMASINDTLSGFVRGQSMVCVVLGVIYSAGLFACGLKYGLTVGIIAGVLTIIPYVGTVFGITVSLLLAFVQFDGNMFHVLSVGAVFFFGHMFEAYFLTPRFVGNRVGLHPIWILFSLIAGVKLMGFLGVLIAVPTAATMGVLIRFGARQYKNSSLYI